MAIRKSQQASVNKYISKNYDRVNLTMPKGKRDILQAAAKYTGESVNAFINRLIDNEIERLERAGGGFSFPDTENFDKQV